MANAFALVLISLLLADSGESSEQCTKAKCGGQYSCDEWIAYNPTKYSCPELERDYKCDCSGCKCGGGPSPSPGPSPTPHGQLQQVLFKDGTYPGAVCLDGSPGGYFIRKGSSDRFVIYFQGGGWCYDPNGNNPSREGTLGNCQTRSQGSLGSSKGWSVSGVEREMTGMLSSSASENPDFYNYTIVYAPYCDGFSFTGDNEVQYQGSTLHFKGTAILDAIIADLKSTTKIGNAARVVISGGSAGASAVYYHADKIVHDFGLAAGVGVAAPDAGFFLNLQNKDGVYYWPNQMRSIAEVANGYKDLHAGCLSKYPKEQWKCMFPEYYADLIETRWLNIMSLYDSSELWYTLTLDCCPGNCLQAASWLGVNMRSYPKCKGAEMKLFEDLRQQHLDAWKPLTEKTGNGVWAPACITHTMSWGHWTDKSWEVPGGSGNTMAKVVAEWLADDSKAFNYADAVAWPQNSACAGSDLEYV